MARRYELTFWGAAMVRAYRIPRYRRYHRTWDAARDEAQRVFGAMAERDLPAAAHPAIIYHPSGRESSVTATDCGPAWE